MKKTILYTLTGITISGMAQAATLQNVMATTNPGAEGWTITLTSGDGGQNGEFNGDSATNGGGSAAGAGATAWALYANSGATATARYNISGGALSIGQTLTMDFDNGWVNNATDNSPNPAGQVGIRLLQDGVVGFEFSFTGGTSNYMFDDGTVADSGIPFTADGLDVNFTITGSGQYSIDNGGTFTGTLNNSLASINQIEVFNISAGPGDERNVFFNNLSVVPEPSSIALLGLGGLALILRRCK